MKKLRLANSTTPDLMEAVQNQLLSYQLSEDWDSYYRLDKVYELLPTSPFFAILEAEYQKLPHLVPILRKHFGILPLG